MKANILVSALVALVISGLAFVGFQRNLEAPAETQETPAVQEAPATYGAVASPDSPFRWMSVGGVRNEYTKTTALNQATSSVICTILSPVSTSTLIHGSIQLTSATGTVTSLSFTKSLAPYAIGSTILSSTTVASGAQISFTAASSTQTAQTNADLIFSPSTYLLVTQLGGGILNQTGSCEAIFTVF